jgi:hypothetical protein
MELILNLAWALLAAMMIAAWLRVGVHKGSSRSSQLVVLAVLVLILFPVISVSDDLQTAQSPAEADCCMRRDHIVAAAHSVLPVLASMLHPIAAIFMPGVSRVAAPGDLRGPVTDQTGRSAIENRPPPATC